MLDAWGLTYGSHQWSVTVQGLGNDKTKASLQPDKQYITASIYKLFFTYTLFQKYSLDNLSSVQITPEGRSTTDLKSCLELAIKRSDNPCAEAIGDKLGWGATTTALKKLGMNSTNLNDPTGLKTTAADTALFLQKMNNGQLMGDDQRDYILGLMQQQVEREGIPAGCSDCTVADKTV